MDDATTNAVNETRVDPADWERALGDAAGPQIVVGGPGTGKTEFLVRRVVHLIEIDKVPATSLLLLSFGRRGTADLEHRIRTALTVSVPQIDVSTFHSFAARVVERRAADLGWDDAPQILTGPEQVDVVQRLLARSDRSRWSPAFRGLLGSPTFAREVTDLVLRAREQVLSPAQIADLADARADWRGLPAFIADYDTELKRSGRIDYGTLLAAAVEALDRPDMADPIIDRLSHILVDEYQDTTAAQARLLELLAQRTTNLTAVADPYQSIYSFRGADLHNVEDFPNRFRDADGNPGRRVVLTTSFRTPQKILDAAVRVTSGDLPGAAGPVVPAPGNGRVDVYRFDQETEEAEWIAGEMQRLHLEDGLPYAAMGVFVRSKRRFLPDLVRALARRGMPHDAPDDRLADRSPVRFVLDLIAAATGSDGPAATARAVRRVLLGPLYRLPLGQLRRVERHRLSAEAPSWAAAIRAEAGPGAEIAGLIEDSSWADGMPARAGLWHIWDSLTAIPGVVLDPSRAPEREAWSSLSQVLHRWNDRNPQATLADYRRLTADEDFEARPLLSYRAAAGDRPTITTLHQSKGLEFEVVFIADAVEGVFPDLRATDSLLGVRHLMPHLPDNPAEYKAFRLQEERRLAYTAMSRARRRVVWTATSTGFEEGRGIPSRFLALVAGTATVTEAAGAAPGHSDPVTPREAEGMLRRLLVDPAEVPSLRLAALTVLAGHRNGRLREPMAFAGMKRRGPDVGIIPDELTLSPTQAEAYDVCPRRYALARRLRIGAATSIYAEFGSLIHDVLETVERSAMEAGEQHATADQAKDELIKTFDPAAFGGLPFSDSWLTRGVKALDHLYANWPSPGMPVALEHATALNLGGLPWFGRVDRIETDGDGLRIVDYKTTGSPPLMADVQQSLQLGFYVLAAAADPDLPHDGTAHSAVMWFPAAGGKSVKTRSLELENLPDIKKRLVEAGAGIRDEKWTPRPGPHCDRCPVRPLCPAWFEGREAFA